MHYMLMPLDEHFDLGFGAIADAFQRSAMTLIDQHPDSIFLEHLPQSFLLRHAVELFLKSGIVILHRRLKLPFDKNPHDSEPMVPVGAKWKSIYQIHGIGTLYSHWKSLIERRTRELQQMCKFTPDWTIGPAPDDWVRTIDLLDPGSTYFRYPSGRNALEDRQKPPFKRTAPEDLFPANRPEDKKIMALVVENAQGDVVKTYVHEKGSDEHKAYMDALINLSKLLFNYHAMMRFELTGGF